MFLVLEICLKSFETLFVFELSSKQKFEICFQNLRLKNRILLYFEYLNDIVNFFFFVLDDVCQKLIELFEFDNLFRFWCVIIKIKIFHTFDFLRNKQIYFVKIVIVVIDKHFFDDIEFEIIFDFFVDYYVYRKFQWMYIQQFKKLFAQCFIKKLFDQIKNKTTIFYIIHNHNDIESKKNQICCSLIKRFWSY